jgi:ATP-dependent DNA ligase
VAEYIVQKPIDLTKLTGKARKQLDAIPSFDITPKYDGCCAVLAFDNLGRFYGAFSATGESVLSLDHVGDHIARRWEPQLRGIALIGEAWMPNTEFPVINGTFRRQSVQRELRFVPFDAVHWCMGPEGLPLLDDPRPYRERIGVLARGYDGDFVIPVIHHGGNLDDADKMAKVWKAEGGFDGAIARDPFAPYAVGRCKFEVVKVKPTLSLDLAVTGVFVEPGEKTGRPVYTLEVIYQGVRSMVGSGVPHQMSDDIAEGTIVEVECMGITPDGKLREPRFKGIRYDKVGAD